MRYATPVVYAPAEPKQATYSKLLTSSEAQTIAKELANIEARISEHIAGIVERTDNDRPGFNYSQTERFDELRGAIRDFLSR